MSYPACPRFAIPIIRPGSGSSLVWVWIQWGEFIGGRLINQGLARLKSKRTSEFQALVYPSRGMASISWRFYVIISLRALILFSLLLFCWSFNHWKQEQLFVWVFLYVQINRWIQFEWPTIERPDLLVCLQNRDTDPAHNGRSLAGDRNER